MPTAACHLFPIAAEIELVVYGEVVATTVQLVLFAAVAVVGVGTVAADTARVDTSEADADGTAALGTKDMQLHDASSCHR